MLIISILRESHGGVQLVGKLSSPTRLKFVEPSPRASDTFIDQIRNSNVSNKLVAFPVIYHLPARVSLGNTLLGQAGYISFPERYLKTATDVCKEYAIPFRWQHVPTNQWFI